MDNKTETLKRIEVAMSGLGNVWIPDNESHIRVYRGDEYIAVYPDEAILDGKTVQAGRIEGRSGARCAEIRQALRAADIYPFG